MEVNYALGEKREGVVRQKKTKKHQKTQVSNVNTVMNHTV